MYKSVLTVFFFCLTRSTYAQQKNIGALQIAPLTVSSYVGIAHDGKVQFYLQKPDEKKDGYFWQPIGEFSIPAGTIAMAGNERKLIVLFKDSIVFYDESYEEGHDVGWERRHALSFDTTIRITPENWLRNGYSTECDFTYLQENQEKGYSYDGDKWLNLYDLVYKKTKPEQPIIPCGEHNYLFGYQTNGIIAARITNDSVTFCIPSMLSLPMVKKYVKEEEIDKLVRGAKSRNFALPPGTESAFIYMWEIIAVVNKQGVDFYQYSEKDKKWGKKNDMTLLFK